MTCQTCDDKGLVRVNWNDAPEDYAVCLCPSGELLRVKHGGIAGWVVLASRMDIEPTRVVMLEDACTPDELAARGFRELSAPDAMSAVAAAARGRKVGR